MTTHATQGRTNAYYNDFSLSYDEPRHGGYHAWIDRNQARIVAEHAIAPTTGPERIPILEVGCGTGLLMARLRDRGFAVQGVDPSVGMLQRARERGLDVFEATGDALPFEEHRFQVSYCFKVLPHVYDVQAVLREMVRVTRPGGVIIVDQYNRLSWRYAARLWARCAGGRPTGTRHREEDIMTRWSWPWQSPPSGVEDLGPWALREGLRVFTPVGSALGWPRLGPALQRVERWACTTPFKVFAGFVVRVAPVQAPPRLPRRPTKR